MNVCQICGEYLEMKDTQTIRMWEKNDREYIDVVGHIKCSEEIWKKIKAVKDRDKKSPQKILSEIGLKLL